MEIIINTKEYLKSIIPTVSVSVMSADFLNLGQAISDLEQADVKLLHIDVMDGNFCPTMTIGSPVIKQIKTKMLKDVHLMIMDPLLTIEQYIEAGANMITIQYETTIHQHRTLQVIKEKNPDILRGISINPGTPYNVVESLVDEIDMIVILAINPGWNGQKYVSSTGNKFECLKTLLKDKKKEKEIFMVIDGGVTLENIKEISMLKPDIIVSGSAIYKGNMINHNFQEMMNKLDLK
jgi:ribulose-phosphate 3-epimerase